MRLHTSEMARPTLLLMVLFCLLSTFTCVGGAGPLVQKDPDGNVITGCPCKTRTTCNHCCIVEHGALSKPASRGAALHSCSLLSHPRCGLIDWSHAGGVPYGPHCRAGMCGAGKFPNAEEQAENPWTPQSPGTEFWGQYW